MFDRVLNKFQENVNDLKYLFTFRDFNACVKCSNWTLAELWKYFTLFSSVSIADFEQVNVSGISTEFVQQVIGSYYV